MSTYLRLLQYLRPHLPVFGIALGCMVVSSLLNGVQLGAIFPLADRIVTDRAIPVPEWAPGWLAGMIQWLNGIEPLSMVTMFAATIPILFFLKGLFEFWQALYMNDASQRVMRDLRQALFDKFMRLGLDYHHKSPTGVTMSRILYDTGIVQNSITEGFTDIAFQGLQVLMFLGISLSINWKLSLVIAVIVPLIAWPIGSIGKRLKKFSHESQRVMGEFNATVLESIAGIQVIQSFLVEPAARAKFAAFNDRFYRITLKAQKP